MTSRSKHATRCGDCGKFCKPCEFGPLCDVCAEARYDEAHQHSPQVTHTDRDYQREGKP